MKIFKPTEELKIQKKEYPHTYLCIKMAVENLLYLLYLCISYSTISEY